MDFRRLQAFSRVYELQSFSRAGKDLFLSQPTVSTHVLSLEEELEVRLFDRIGRTVIPTQAGQALYSGVRKVFKILDETKADIHNLTNKVCGRVVVGGSTIPSNYILPLVISDYRKKYPEVRIDLRVGDSIKVCRDVLSGDLDFGIVGGFADHFDLEHELLMRDRLVIIYNPGLHFRLPSRVSPEDLLSLPWVFREKGSGTRQAFENALAERRIPTRDFKVTTLVQSTEALVRCVLAGVGVGVTSGLVVQKYLDSGELLSLDVPDLDIKRNFYIIRHKRRSLFACSGTLMEAVRKHIKNNTFGG
jgi:DNA-binding transcriptional LysR family regulator